MSKWQRPPQEKPITAELATPTASRRPKTQFTIFGLMVLMFVASASFAQLYYAYRGSQWDSHQQAKKDFVAQIETARSSGQKAELKSLEEELEKLKAKDKFMTDASSSRAIAVLMAVALPMLLMTVISIAYSARGYFARKRRRISW